ACSTLAMIGWIILILFPFWKSRDRFVLGIIVMLFAVVYCWLIIVNFDKDLVKSFGTLDGVATLFLNRQMLLAGWIHYLAFDLFAGIYIVRNAKLHNINHWLTTPTLLLTFMFGPVGLLLYTLLRWGLTKRYLADA
ncbi:MAG: DUF4281 domain-containing protein, partial [Chitinophagaceae bacterium]